MRKVRVVLPAGTVIFQYCCEPAAPEMGVTVTLFVSDGVVSGPKLPTSDAPAYALKPLSITYQVPAAGLPNEQLSVLPATNGRQSYTDNVGAEPNRTYM